MRSGEAWAAVRGSRTGNFALPVCLAAMDGCWIYLVAWFLGTVLLRGGKLQPVPSPVVLAGLELLSWWLYGYLAKKTSLAMSSVQALWVVAGLAGTAGILLAEDPTFNSNDPLQWAGTSAYAMVVCLTLWVVGGYRAYKPQSSDTAYTNFRAALIGVSAVALLAVIVARQHVMAQAASIGAISVWFFAWSMVALILGKREVVREGSGEIDAGPWGLVSVASIAVVAAIGYVGGAFGAQDPLEAARNVVTNVLGLLALLAYGFLYPIFWLASLLGINITPRRDAGVPNETLRDWGDVDPVELARREMEPGGTHLGIPQDLVGLIAWLLIGLVAVVIVVAISRRWKRRWEQTERGAEEGRENLGVRSRLARHFAGWVKGMLSRFRRGAARGVAVSEGDLSALVGRPEWRGSLTVRQIYIQLQAAAGRLGYPRGAQVTPVEYLSVLSRAMPDMTADLECVTSAYIEARYSPLPVTAPAVLAANEAWKRLETGFRAAGKVPAG